MVTIYQNNDDIFASFMVLERYMFMKTVEVKTLQ